MPIELYARDGHRCLLFTGLGEAGGDAAQSNQVLVIDGDTGALIDPGGTLVYPELYLGVSRLLAPGRLSALLATHADPDVIGSLDRWTSATAAPIYLSRVWERLVPHLCRPGKTAGRVIGIPDAGLRIPLGRGELIALPAHFLHAEGHFQFYDPTSRILFSGDLGTSLGEGAEAARIATSLAPLLLRMEGFHRRHMASNKVLRLWADMVSTLPIDLIVPQHGAPLAGPAVAEFIAWVRELPCGVDLVGPQDYRIPS